MPKKKLNRCLCLLVYCVLCLDLVEPQTVVSGEGDVAEKNRYEVSRRLMGVKFRFVVYANSLAMAEKGTGRREESKGGRKVGEESEAKTGAAWRRYERSRL